MISISTASYISLLTAIIVAVLSHFFATKRQRRSELAEYRLKAYTDFVKAASRLAAARRIGVTNDELKDLAAINEAKARICICGEKEVIEELIEFWKYGGTLEKEEEILAFKRLILRFRESIGVNWKEIATLEISDVLFKLEPSDYSFKKRNDN